MTIGALTLELLIPESHSLKDKRHVIQSLMKKLRNQFNVSVAEVEHQDVWQRSTIAVVSVNSSPAELDRTLDYVVNFVQDDEEIENIRIGVEHR